MKCPGCQIENPPTSRFCADCGTSLTPVAYPPGHSPHHGTLTIPPSPDLETGALFAGRYQIIEKIGAGGMGRVFKVFDTKIRERIAIKLLRPEIAFDEKTLERFRSEIRLARRISHKNVCRMFDMGEHAGVHYITMELVPGESLKSIIRMTAPLSIPAALHYAREICEGLEEAHRWDIVHRDLKPQNIMVDPTGTVRIMDFGIARTLRSEVQTDPGVAVGSPEYMSPEQAEGLAIDHRTDIYALGIVFYEMVTGKAPFAGDSALSILRKQELERPRPPRELNPMVSERLNRLILKCLEKSREHRYQSAGEVLQELGTIQTDTPKVGEHKSRTVRNIPVEGPRRRVSGPARLGLVGLALAALVAGGYLFVYYAVPRLRSQLAPAPGGDPTGPAEARKHVAVLPFDVENPDARSANLGNGLAEAIRTRLSISGARVLSPYSSEAIRKSPDRQAETLKANVGRYLQGTLRVGGDAVSVSVNLIDAESESILWSRVYTEKLAGIYADVPDRISLDAAKELRTAIGRDQLRALRRQSAVSLDAYIAVVNGREATNVYWNTAREEDFAEAMKLLETAIGLDPGYALAYRSLGDLYESRYVAMDRKEDLEAMVTAYKKAYDLDPAVPRVHAGLGWAYFHQGRFDDAYKSLKQALSYDPEDPTANRDAGSFLRSIGLDEPALKHYQIASEGDPLEPTTYYLHAACYMNLGDYKNAGAKIGLALAISPDDPTLRLWNIRLLLLMGRTAEAEKDLDALEADAARSPTLRAASSSRRALVLALKGDRNGALALLAGIKDPYRFEITNAYCVLGMKTEAVRQIKSGNEAAFRLIKDYLYSYPYLITNPHFKVLADEPGFQAFIREERARYEARLAKYGDL